MFGVLVAAVIVVGVWALISETGVGWKVTITVTPTVPESGREAFLQKLQTTLPSTSRLEAVDYRSDKTVVVIRSTDSVRPPEATFMLGPYSLRSEVSP